MSYLPEDDNEARLAELRVQAARSDLTARAEAIEEMAFIHFQDDGVAPREKLPYIMAAIDLARSLGRERELGILSNMASDVYERLTEHEQAIEYALEALRIAREHMTSLYLTEVTSRLARLERRRGNFVLALDFYAQAHEAALDSGNDYFAGFAALLYSSQILGSMDLFDQAVDKADEAFHYARTHWNSACMSDALNEKAWCLYRLGSIDEMVEVLEEAAAHLESVLSPWSHEFLAINECAYELETKPSEATLQRLDALREVARERWNGNASVAVINYLRAQYFAKVGEIDESLKLLRKIDLLRGSDYVHRFSAYTIQMQSVQFALSDGRHEQAAEFLRNAMAHLACRNRAPGRQNRSRSCRPFGCSPRCLWHE
jgi:tetratricopeptide (TPR) repeat protein